MRILAVSNLYPPFVIGGYELNCAVVMTELRARGHAVMVATSANHVPGPPDRPDVRRCLRAPSFGPDLGMRVAPEWSAHLADTSDFDNVAALHGLLQEFRPDVVLLWNLHGLGGLHLIDFLNVNEVPWAIYLGDRVYERVINGAPDFIRSIFRGHDTNYLSRGGVMAVSRHLVEEIERLCGFAFAEAPTIVHGYVAPPRPPRPRGYRRDGRCRFLSAGRVAEHKGLTVICDAAALLARDGDDDFEIDVFGEGDVAFYVNYAAAKGVGDRLRFHGGISQAALQAEFESHDAFLFPTWSREPFGFAPLEAAAHGCVPIITADAGCAERIVHRVHGIKIERSAAALAEAMRGVADGSIDIARIGRAAAAMVRMDLGLEAHADRIVEVLERQVRDRPRHADEPRAMLLAFVKHHLSVAHRFGVAC